MRARVAAVVIVIIAVFGFDAMGGRIMPSNESINNPEIRIELMQMVEADQVIRRSVPSNPDELSAIDRRNTTRLKELVDQLGWPTAEMVGTDGVMAAWLLAQHADHDPQFQKRVLLLMEDLLSTGRAPRDLYAYLFDRTHVPQRYGTQGRCTPSNTWEPREIENPAAVDDRRREMRMPPLAEYMAAATHASCVKRTATPENVADPAGPLPRSSSLSPPHSSVPSIRTSIPEVAVESARYFVATHGTEPGIIDLKLKNGLGTPVSRVQLRGEVPSNVLGSSTMMLSIPISIKPGETRHVQMQTGEFAGVCSLTDLGDRREVGINVYVVGVITADGKSLP